MHGRLRLAEGACQLHRVNERRPAEGVELLSIRDRDASRVAEVEAGIAGAPLLTLIADLDKMPSVS